MDFTSDNVLFEDSDMPMIALDDEIVIEAIELDANGLVLFEDSEMPMRESDDELLSEISQEFIEASPFFAVVQPQTGEGFQLEEAIKIDEVSRRDIKKYNAEEVTFRAHVLAERLPQRFNPLVLTIEVVRLIFTMLITDITQNLRGHDLIRFFLQGNGLDRPISSALMPVSNLTLERLLSAVIKVLQSKDEIPLDSGFTVDVITIRREAGAGGGKKITNIEIDRLKKRSVLSIPMDVEGLCCAKAILYGLAHLAKDRSINALRDRRRPTLENRARALHESADVPVGPCTNAEIATFENHLNVQVVVISAQNLNKVSYKGPLRARRINLWLHNGHYDVISSLKGFYGSSYYCEVCDKPYNNFQNHRCAGSCHICLRSHCIKADTIRCFDCDRLCQSEDCYMAHKAKPGRQQLSMCDQMYQCRVCSRVILRRHCPQDLHRCWTTKCPSCAKFVLATDHKCFLRVIPSKNPSDRLIFFDFETDQSSGEHMVNFAVAQYAQGEDNVFKRASALNDFCTWLFSKKHKDYTAIAHNMKGFDGQFIMAWLLAQGTPPDVIPNGSKVMAITCRSLNLRIIDSFNFLPMGLSKLPACFGLTELKKGFFPHLFNIREHQEYVGILPEAKYYSPDCMTPSARAAFLDWHKEHENDTFHFQDEMLSYCKSDVDILRRCCLEFRGQFIGISEVDPFCYVTIASACMAVFRSKHIQDNTIAMVPIHGYLNNTTHSRDCIRWLDFVSNLEGINILHALNGYGEKKIHGISVDGYCEEENTIYQFHGCFFHGCNTCFEKDAVNPLLAVTMGTLREKTNKTTAYLRAQGFVVIEKWEHDFIREKKEGLALKSFLSTHKLNDRLKPRDAFFGGRTNALSLFYEGKAKYIDFTSLYPWVNKYCRYPIGHPEIITDNFGDLNNYFGFVQCRVLPPHGLYIPVLPYRCNGKLMFPLCRLCADNMQQDPCEHTEEERALIGTWVTEEVKLAVEKGYRVTHIFEVYHFEETSDSLFRSYIDLFLKIKQESSGWPSECTTPEERNTYVELYKEREGIQLDLAAISKNPGRRQVSKLALNTLWGRWGMNLNKGQLTYVNTLPDFNKMMSDPKKNIKDIYFPTNETAAIHWDLMKDFVPQDQVTNVFLAAFTTAWARIKLFSEMDKLGRSVLYHDTDSIIYISDGVNDPPLGNFLGEFTDELSGDIITTFVSGGPKNYAFSTEKGKTTCKVRGFTLNFRNAQLLNFETVKNLVLSMDRTASIPLYNPSKIVREAKRRKVINKEEIKTYKLVYNKRVLNNDMSTLPYGY